MLHGQIENQDWTLDWTGWTFFRAVVCLFVCLFFGGGVGGCTFFLVRKKIAFSTFRQQAIFFSFGVGGGKDFTFLLVSVLVLHWSLCLTHGRHVSLES